MTRYENGDVKISNSEISTWKDCQRRWYFGYYRWLKRKPTSDDASNALLLGSAVHKALELYYVNGDDPQATIQSLYAERYEEAERLGYFESVVKEIEKEQELASIMLEGFVEWSAENGIDTGMELVGVEERLEAPLTNGVILKGMLDQRWRTKDGRIIFRDWKTSSNFSDLDDNFLLNEQIKMYNLLEVLTDPKRVTDGAEFIMLRKVKRGKTAKPPFYKSVRVRPNRSEIDSMFRRTVKSTTEIITTMNALDKNDSVESVQYLCPPRPSRDCKWKCPFFMICPMMDDGSNMEGLIQERYDKVNPDKRYEDEEHKYATTD